MIQNNGAIAAEQVITFYLVIVFANAIPLNSFRFSKSQVKDLMNLNCKYTAGIIGGRWG